MILSKSAVLVDVEGVARSLPSDVFREFLRESKRWMAHLAESRDWVLHQAFASTKSKADLSELRRAGFDVVESPPITSDGKTATDIRLTVAAIGAAADLNIDDAVLVVGRSDIAPLLHDLRMRGVATTVIGNRLVTEAFEGLADTVIRIDRIGNSNPSES